MKNKLENILFYAAKNINPPKKGLENILANLPVTKEESGRYNNIMGLKFAIPVGILILLVMVFVATGRKTPQPQTVTVLPSTLTKQNVESSLTKVDSVLSESERKMNQDLKELESEGPQESPEDETNEKDSDDLNDL